MEPSEVLYRLDSDFCILVMESGASITIADALDYLAMDIKIAPEPVVPEMKEEADDEYDGEAKPENPEAKPESGDDDDSTLPKVISLDFSHSFAYRNICSILVDVPGMFGKAADGLRVQVSLRRESHLLEELSEGVR